MHLVSFPLSIALSFLYLTGGVAFGFEGLVDQIWNDTRSKPRVICQKFVVQAGPPQILRGKTSGRDCLKHAIAAYRTGDHEEAFVWILSGQCEDRNARVTLVQHAPKVMQYVMDTYGPDVP